MEYQYTTRDELLYLDGLGSHSEAGRKASRARLLELYLASAERRTRWDLIDRETAVARARALLEDELGSARVFDALLDAARADL